MMSVVHPSVSLLFFLLELTAGEQPLWRERTLAANRLSESGDFQAAEQAYRDAVAEAGRLFPAGSRYAESLNNLASLYYATGRYAAAEPLYWNALGLLDRGDNKLAGVVANNLAVLYRAQGRYVEAEPLYRRALDALAAGSGEQTSE